MDPVKRNFTFGTLHEGIWGLSFGLVNPITVAQQVLADLGGNAEMAGLLAALMFAGMNAPQVLSAFFIPPHWTSPQRTALMHLPAISITGLTAAVLYQPLGFPEAWRLPAYLASMLAFFFLIGCIVPHWIACHGRNIPDKMLGRFFGTAFGLSGLTGIAGGVLAQQWILAGGLEWGYAACFAAALPLQLFSVGSLALTKSIGDAPSPAGRFADYVKEQWGNVRHNRTFQVFGLIAILMQLTTASGMLFTSYLNTQGNAQAVVGWTTAFIQIGSVVGAVLLGWLEDWKGPRAALALAFVVFLASLGWINAGLGLKMSTVAFAGSGFFNTAFPVVTTYLVLTLAPKGRQLVFTGLFNTLMAPWALAPIALGWIAETWSYQAAFVVSAAASLLALLLLSVLRGFGKPPAGGSLALNPETL